MKKELLMMAFLMLLAVGCSSGSRQTTEAEDVAAVSESEGSASEVAYACPMGADCSDEVKAEAGACNACGMELKEVVVRANTDEGVEEVAPESATDEAVSEEAPVEEEGAADEATN